GPARAAPGPARPRAAGRLAALPRGRAAVQVAGPGGGGGGNEPGGGGGVAAQADVPGPGHGVGAGAEPTRPRQQRGGPDLVGPASYLVGLDRPVEVECRARGRGAGPAPVPRAQAPFRYGRARDIPD